MKTDRRDWTELLRDRLQDARLPVGDEWGSSSEAAGPAAGVPGQKTPGIPVRPPIIQGDRAGFGGNSSQVPANRQVWWPWALAGVAAAILAVVLLLRPATSPVQESDLLVEIAPVPNAGKEESVVLLPQSDPSLLADGFTEERQSTPRTQPTAPDGAGHRAQADAHPTHGLPPDVLPAPVTLSSTAPPPPSSTDPDAPSSVAMTPPSSTAPTTPSSVAMTPPSSADPTTPSSIDPPPPSSADPTTPSFAGLTGESPASDQAPDKEIPALSPTPAENEGAWAFPEEQEARRPGSRRVTLRLQAGFAQTSFAQSTFARQSAAVTYQSAPQIAQDEGLWILNTESTSPLGYTASPDEREVQWLYVPNKDVPEAQNVTVPKARPFPVSVGLSASLTLGRSWALTAGLDYMQRDGYRAYEGSPQSLTLHYLGVPVDIRYYFNPENRWRFYLGAGLHAAKCIAVSGGVPLQDPVLFSGSLMAGTDFRLFQGVRICLAPTLSVPFNRSAYVNTWDDRLQFQVRAGLSFDLK